MTTIVYRDGIVAADSQATSGYCRVLGVCEKIIRISKNRVVAFTGGQAAAMSVIAWLKRTKDETLDVPDVDATVIVFDGGAPLIIESGGSFRAPVADFYAWGTGSNYALGAMATGSSPQRAVEIACLFDVYSGGQVFSVPAPPPA